MRKNALYRPFLSQASPRLYRCYCKILAKKQSSALKRFAQTHVFNRILPALIKKRHKNYLAALVHIKRKEALMRATPIYSLSAELGANTIDPDKLNFRVRNGNGCDLVGINITLIKASYYKRTNG